MPKEASERRNSSVVCVPNRILNRLEILLVENEVVDLSLLSQAHCSTGSLKYPTPLYIIT